MFRFCAGVLLQAVIYFGMILPQVWADLPAVADGALSGPATTLTPLPAKLEIASSGAALAIPEPVSLAVFAMGILLLFRRRRF